jgi:glycogen debranching enzyme
VSTTNPELQSSADEDYFALPEGEPMGIEDIRDVLIIRERASTLMTDSDGNIPPDARQGLGLYHADTRHLSTYRMTLERIPPVMLLSTAELGYAMEQVMTNPALRAPDGRRLNQSSTEIRRQRVVSDVVEEQVRITNYNAFPVRLALLYEFDADFADIFDVRGYVRTAKGHLHEPEVSERSVLFAYDGVDGRTRTTRISFDRTPEDFDGRNALFHISLERRETATLRLRISLNNEGARRQSERLEAVADQYQRWMEGTTHVFTDNEFFNRVLSRSLHDIRMLASVNEDGHQFLAAGTPWFDALFGRDSCIVSTQMLAYRPELARNTLRLLARCQGTEVDRERDEEAGKIVHEMRFDELSRSGELPYGPYYGSIDSTPLFLMLLASYYEWTADTRFVRELLPAVRAAIAWMDTAGDPAGDGYLTYEKRSAKGLVNQGWKDSWDAVVQPDGTLAHAPIALVEVQGYAYFARARLASVLERAGDARLAAKLRREGRRLYQRFNRDFWMDDHGYYAFALDGDRRPVASIASNPAHCLWAGLIDPARAGEVVSRLMANDMFSGWGLRTLSAGNPRFNPIGYHLGSIWPHDNSIAAMGFKMYGCEDELNEVATALFDAAASFPYFRLPELFGGEARSAHRTPVPYPVACRPQAWAAGAFPLITQAILGLKPEAPERRLRIVGPRLPYWLNSVQVRNLHVGNGVVTLQYRRQGNDTRVEIQEATGNIDVIISNRWPLD